MPSFEKKDYHLISTFIKKLEPTKDDPSDVLQTAFINNKLTEDEIRYLISEQEVKQDGLTFPTQLHALIASQSDSGVKLVLDRLYKMQSQEEKETKEIQHPILDPIVGLSTSKGANLIHLMAFCSSKECFYKLFSLVSRSVLADATLSQSITNQSGFLLVAKYQDAQNFLALLNVMSKDQIESIAQIQDDIGSIRIFFCCC